MDFLALIGLLGNLITFEETGRSWKSVILSKINSKREEKKITFLAWDTQDEGAQLIIDKFKTETKLAYKDHIFTDGEIACIIKEFIKSCSDYRLSVQQKKDIGSFISVTLKKYNEYNRAKMSAGERILLDSIHNLDGRLDSISVSSSEIAENVSSSNYKINYLLDAEKRENTEAFLREVEVSKTIGLDTIDCTINGEYRINRSKLVDKVKKDGHRLVFVQGFAGCGKSALCKSIVEDEKYLLFARAEQLVQAKRLDDVWGFRFEDAIRTFSEYKIVVYIDALEFIADYSIDKFRVLQELLDVVHRNGNVFFLSSCRTTERNAFLKLQTKYNIETYEIEDISIEEMSDIITHFPVIGKLSEQKEYAELLKTPFYINLVVSNGIKAEDITDENQLRYYIWDNLICLASKASVYGIEASDVCNAVNQIVFDRAQKFLLGIPKDEIKTSILEALQSEGIVCITGNLVRLKYDIFEDICFERYFDNHFEECRGDIVSFYDEIAKLGPCVYRRYQIWIANKLFIQKRSDSVISKVLFTDGVDNHWKKQTEIGIVKSKYCDTFFREYIGELVQKALIGEFVTVVNLYAFEARLISSKDNRSLSLVPIGKARESLVILLFKENLYKNEEYKKDILKLCSDISKYKVLSPEAAKSTCNIMEYYLEIAVNDRQSGWYYTAERRLGAYLTVLFQFAECSKEWLNQFLRTVKEMYCSKSEHDNRWATDIAVWILENTCFSLVKNCKEDLCDLANCIFFEEKPRSGSCYGMLHEKEAQYGLSDNADMHGRAHEFGYRVFLINLFRADFKLGLEWAIKFTNKAFECLASNSPDSVCKVTLFFPEKDEKREYWGNGEMWMARVQEYHVPTLLSDIIYYLKEEIILLIETYQTDSELCNYLLEFVQGEIFEKANNVAMLGVIGETGLHFQNEYPGYALELASSIEILLWDISRYSLYIPNATMELLKNQLMQTIGISTFKDRYSLDKKCSDDLRGYVGKCQLIGNKKVREKAEKIIDYLYALIDAKIYGEQYRINVAQMDMRNPTVTELGDGRIAISATLPETVKPLLEERREDFEEKNQLLCEYNTIIESASRNIENVNYSRVDEVIDKIVESLDDETSRITNEEKMVELIVIALCNKSISVERRSNLCRLWIDGVKRYFLNETFVADIKWIPILFKQIDNELREDVQRQLRELLLESIISRSKNGQVSKIAEYGRQYLEGNQVLATQFFYTIVKLAEDEMNHQIFNAKVITDNGLDSNFVFIPNKTKALRGIDYRFSENREDGYKCNKEEIVEKYLVGNMQVDIEPFMIDQYDIRTICFVANCGLSLENAAMNTVIRGIIMSFIDICSMSDVYNSAYDIIGFDAEYVISSFLKRELCRNADSFERTLSIMFDEIDFSKFKKETMELYLGVFEQMIYQYFDAYSDNQLRIDLEKRIKKLEDRVDKISVNSIREWMYKSPGMIFSEFFSDISKCKTQYNYRDKMFLNRQYMKYAKYHLSDFIDTLYQMKMNELLPEIILSVSQVLEECRQRDIETYTGTVIKKRAVIERLIVNAYLFHSDDIKSDVEISAAYMRLLELLIELNNEKAAVLLDEFFIH